MTFTVSLVGAELQVTSGEFDDKGLLLLPTIF